MVSEKAIKDFLESMWHAAEQNGWPVNAMEIGMRLFGSDEEAARISTRNVLGACTTR